MPRKNTTTTTKSGPQTSKPDAAAQVAEAILNGSKEDIKKLSDSEDENVKEAFGDMGVRVSEMANSQLAWGQQVMEQGRQNKFIGNAMAVSDAATHAQNAYKGGKKVYEGGAWVVGKIGGLLG